MDCAKSSEVQEHCESGDTQREIIETSGQSTSRTENATNYERIHETEAGDSGPEEKKNKIKQVPTEPESEDLGGALVKSSRAESIPKPDDLAGLESILEFLRKIILSHGGRIQARQWLILGISASEQLHRTGGTEDLGRALEYRGAAIIRLPSSQTELWALLNNPGCAYWSRFKHLGHISKLSKAVKFGAKAVSLNPSGNSSKPGYLGNLGNSYSSLFGRLGELQGLGKAIGWKAQVVMLSPNGHPGNAKYLDNLGVSYDTRFRHLGELSDLNKAIECRAQAVSLTPGCPSCRSRRLNNLGDSYEARFQRLGQLLDLKKAIECQGQAPRSIIHDRFEHLGELSDLSKAIEFKTLAISLAPDSHLGKPLYLGDLGCSYLSLFGRLDRLSDLDSAIEYLTQAASLTCDCRPDRPGILSNLGRSYATRFGRLGGLSDLNKAIELQTKGVSLTPDCHTWKTSYLCNLGVTYTSRFERLDNLSDLHKAIEYHAQAVLLARDGSPGKPLYLTNLGSSYANRFRRLGELSDLNKAIELGARAVSLSPDNHPDQPAGLSLLGSSYMTRFSRLEELSDMNKAIECQLRAVLLTPDGHPDKPGYLHSLGASYGTRFGRLGELSDLNEAIESKVRAVLLTRDGHPKKPLYLGSLGASYSARFGHLGELLDLNKAIQFHSQAVMLFPDGHLDKPAVLDSLGTSYRSRFNRLGELSDLNKAIDSGVQAISLAPDDHPAKPSALADLGSAYQSRFWRLGQIADLNNAVDFKAKAVSLIPDGHPERPGYLNNLGTSYTTRFRRLSQRSDLLSAESLFSTASLSPTGPPSVRFHACKHWVGLTLYDATLSPLPAYQQAISLIPQLVWVGSTIGRRYQLVAEVSNLATAAASCAIATGAYELALEWLEAGRSIVWGQIAQLRTPFEHLSSHHPKLAEDLVSVGRQLEHAGSRSPLSSSEITEPNLGQEARNHVSLALRWDSLLNEVRSMPGFENFSRSPKVAQLLGAAKDHPVVVINLRPCLCDALILRPDSNIISHVALPHFSYKEAISVHQNLFCHVRDRRPGPSLNPLGSLQSPLDSLWSHVVKPVLNALGYTRKLPVDQLPRVTWCTSGPLSFLPLHAARSREEPQLGTFDLVVSSHTPTLSALLSSQSIDAHPTCGILVVGQGDTPGLAALPCTTKELAVIQKHARPEYYLQLEDAKATVERVLDAMDQFSWVHMACHGSQDADDPTKSAFHLHDGNITLADITKRSFTNKGLAFLSACQTATGDKKMPDEAVHLAAGMLMAGYPSVIATMWSIADEDGPEVADWVYAELLKDGKMDHRSSARALHGAVSQLRDKVGPDDVARWAPFIHFGC